MWEKETLSFTTALRNCAELNTFTNHPFTILVTWLMYTKGKAAQLEPRNMYIIFVFSFLILRYFESVFDHATMES